MKINSETFPFLTVKIKINTLMLHYMPAKAENKRFINPQAINLKSFMEGEAR